jgi:hypothetical protein
MSSRKTRASLAALTVLGLIVAGAASAQQTHTTNQFSGAKANTGTATHMKKDGHNVLRLSDDFVVPDTPAPHWQVVDSHGSVYLLNRLMIKDDRYNQEIQLPDYIQDVATVQIWCAWAEVLLGEASFASPVG